MDSLEFSKDDLNNEALIEVMKESFNNFKKGLKNNIQSNLDIIEQARPLTELFIEIHVIKGDDELVKAMKKEIRRQTRFLEEVLLLIDTVPER